MELRPTQLTILLRRPFPRTRGWKLMAGICLCWCYSGAKLREIGELYGIYESGVNGACNRFE